MVHYNQNWDELGKNIQNTVERAVNSQDYQKLNQNIRQAVNRTVDVGHSAVRNVVNRVDIPNRSNHIDAKKLYAGTAWKTIRGVIMPLVGVPISLVTLLAILYSLITEGQVTGSLPADIFVLIILATGLWLSYSGITTMRLVNRFKIYRRTLGQKTHSSLETLARSVGKSERFVRRDLWKMIRKGFFLEGHLNKEETCLITSHETYQYFEQSRIQMEEWRRQEAATKVSKAPVKHTPQVQEVLNRGNSYLAQIRKCNDDIPGREISDKISHIELIVQRIFERAELHPEVVPDLKKLMDYYLPMTVKLLKAYADMDSQPVQGETMQASKREIEATLDTLNIAFEKLLDDLFVDTAMDVSSDISVLNTLLAQEGLKEDGFSGIKG